MASDVPRHVDMIPAISPRPVEMQVLCLGLSRTSTMSLYTALRKLGYLPYHMVEFASKEGRKNNHDLCWNEALMAKIYGRGKPYGKAEFDKLLGTYSAVTDTPNACFVEELLEAYPKAKVVLTTRDPDKWVDSMERTFYTILDWNSWKALAFVNPKIRAYTSCLELSLVKWTSGDWQNRRKLREGFIRHNEQVRSMVPKDNLLEFTPDMGWEPLCKYLGKPIPEEPYPYVNEGSHAADLHTPIFWIVGAITVARALFWPGVFGIAILGVWRYPKFWFILPLVSSPFLFRIRKIFSGPSPANVLQKH